MKKIDFRKEAEMFRVEIESKFEKDPELLEKDESFQRKVGAIYH